MLLYRCRCLLLKAVTETIKNILVKFILNVVNIIIFFLGVLLGGYLFLHVREHVYMICHLLYVDCVFTIFMSFHLFSSINPLIWKLHNFKMKYLQNLLHWAKNVI